MGKFRFLALAFALALAAPAALPAQENDKAGERKIIPTDWTLARPDAEKNQAKAGSATARRPKAAPRKPGTRIVGGAAMTNRNVRARKKARVGVAIPF